MKNILVTGGCGFIGTNFIHYLLSNPDFDGRIINIDKLTYAGNLENLISVEKEFRDRYIFKQADICDPKALKDVFTTYAVDAICHFAAESMSTVQLQHRMHSLKPISRGLFVCWKWPAGGKIGWSCFIMSALMKCMGH